MAELLLEIFSGEIPARMQESARIKFAEVMIAVAEEFTGKGSIDSWVTPQRIGVCIKGFNLELKVTSQELRGPRVNAPTQALEGFLKKNNLREEQLEARGDYYFAVISNVGLEPKEHLKKLIINALKNFVWPKSMIDGDHDLRWVRPVKSILCLLDGVVLSFVYHHIKAGDYTFGHRFLSEGAIKISSYKDYQEKLKSAYVILSPEERKASILMQAEKALSKYSVNLLKDEDLLQEIAGLVEYPKVFVSEISSEFMKLPKEVLVITLKHHQRYLMTEMQDGNLAPYYLIVANIEPIDNGLALIEGNQKVLNARLSDAKFFYELDLKMPFQDRIEMLKSLTYHKDIGSVYTKQLSVQAMAERICSLIGFDVNKIKDAALLAKCDLTSNMVKEFPELQGVMGYYYMLDENLEFAKVSRDHYKPQGPNDRLPDGLIPSILALADKLDTLNQMFAIGVKPTGSKDPFALRRAALGALRIMKHNAFELDFLALEIRPDVIEFMKERE